MDLGDKVALITGGRRMGMAVASVLARRGCHVALTYRKSKKSARDVVQEVESHARTALAVQSDLSVEEDIRRLIGQIKKKFGRLDILIHMASIYEKNPRLEWKSQEWDKNMNANLKNACALSLQASVLMRKNGWGRIIHFADWTCASGRPRYRGFAPYYVSKAGVLGLTEVLALELAPAILVNAVAPGPILPPAGMGKKERRKVVLETPLGRWGGVEEIAKTVLFLVEAEFITGECIRVDGGRHLH